MPTLGLFAGVNSDGGESAETVASQSKERAGEAGGLDVLRFGLAAFLFRKAGVGCFRTVLIGCLRGGMSTSSIIGEDGSSIGIAGPPALGQR